LRGICYIGRSRGDLLTTVETTVNQFLAEKKIYNEANEKTKRRRGAN
jgi:hypothetical protein